MPNSGMSRREREREQEEREPETVTFTNPATGQNVTIDVQSQGQIDVELRKIGTTYKDALKTDVYREPKKLKVSATVAKGYLVRMLSGNKKYLSEKIGKIDTENALKAVITKGSKYGAIATAIPTLGISTGIGSVIGGGVALYEVFKSGKTAKDILREFITTLFDKSIVKQEKIRAYSFTTIEPVIYKEDINELINVIKQTFVNTKLKNAANSLFLSETHAYYVNDIMNIAKFRVSIESKPITDKTNVKKIGLIGIGLLIIRFLTFKG